MGAVEATVRAHRNAIVTLQQQVSDLTAVINDLQTRPRSVQEQIDAIPGRRIEMVLSGEATFTSSDEGQKGQPILIQVSQDGPFVMTHYPQVLWRPTLPDNATNFGRWRPVSTFPLPDQVVDTDIIDIMYELDDAGSQRFMQNAPRGPLFSRPDNIVPCPVPTLWSPNAAIKFTPTYNALTWDSATPPTQGTLHVDLIGYRIVNM